MPAFTIPLLAAVMLLGAAQAAPAPVWLAQNDFAEGVHYEVIDQPQPVQTGKQIEVLELFWYGCPHCYRLEPSIIEWLKNKPENSDYIALPVVLGEHWEPGARAWYTFEALGLTKALHGEFFHAIHRDNRRLDTAEALADWIAEQGHDREAALNAYRSFTVDAKVRHSARLGRLYGIRGVPSIVVDGKYLTSVGRAGGHEQLFQVIEFLVQRAAGERAE